MSKKPYYDTWKVRRPYGTFIKHASDFSPNGWEEGTVATPHGLVGAYTEDKITRFDFILGGYCHTLTLHRRYTRRGMVMVGARFAKATAQKAAHPHA